MLRNIEYNLGNEAFLVEFTFGDRSSKNITLKNVSLRLILHLRILNNNNERISTVHETIWPTTQSFYGYSYYQCCCSGP
ncbi:unnamed protein product [Leptosia nina]|uniref:Uncharacterized protein n=1 Tax=Leptosia nina TaxID=320188 RepID=A0AAV1IT13_9NEOP